MRKKAGHLGGWGFVLLLEGQVLYDFGVIRPEHLKPFAAILAQVLPVITFARRLPLHWLHGLCPASSPL